jgi:hypothetical protein
MPDSAQDSTGIQTADASSAESDGGATSARESGPYGTAEFESKPWEHGANPEDIPRLRLQWRIAQIAFQMTGMLDSQRTTDGVRDNYGLFRNMFEVVLDSSGTPWKWTAENERQAKNPKAMVAGADWCGIFAAYVLTRAGQPTQFKMWSERELKTGIIGRRLAKKGVDRIEPGDICVMKNPIIDGEVKQNNHHCVVVSVNQDGTLTVVNGNDSGQTITIGRPKASEVAYWYKGT